jgi:hypothetical protein
MQKNMKRFLLIFLYVLLFFAVRFYFYQSPLIDEEGMFAEIVVNRPDAPNFLLSGRIDGQNIYHWPAHPIGMYYLVRATGSFSSPLINMVSWQDDTQITPLLRFLFSLGQFGLFLWMIVFLAFRNGTPSLAGVLIILAVAISPTAVITSANLQIDGSIGALMSGLLALVLLYISSFQHENIASRIFLFAAAFFLAVGKQEWSIIAMGALLFAALYMCICRSRDSVRPKPDALMLLIVLAGLAAGNLFSYLLESRCYLGGLHVFWSFSQADQILEGQFDLQKWLGLTSSRMRWICIPIALIGISGILVINKFKRLKTADILLWLYGVGLFGAYFLSNWNPESRYFAPSMIVLAIAVIALLPSKIHPRLMTLIALCTFLMFTADGIFLFNNIVRKPQKPYFDASQIILKPDQIAILTTADAWNKINIDFSNLNNGRKISEDFARRYNKTLYPEDYIWWDDKKSTEDKSRRDNNP